MHNFDETCVSLSTIVQEMKSGREKTANISTKNLGSFITVNAHGSMTHLKQQKSFGFYITCTAHRSTRRIQMIFDVLAVSLSNGP